MDSDSTQVRLLQDGGAVDGSLVLPLDPHDGSLGPRHISLVERLGDSVLLNIGSDASSTDETSDSTEVATQAALFSLLIIKGNEGWRIRDLVPLTNSPY